MMMSDLKMLIARSGNTLLVDALGALSLAVMLIAALHLPGAA
ncbi:hypothetical protein RM543_15120 [Roseicyclus sp. F158]|uniref:Uncharacterized protein n=1 Tax=Tropicimonas omnivorans TaxID=3075590 RepID=A0ABU3DJX9_9RHOB|nr:hypothetical protein [Roseicyclus sp. F158]MDT0684020.1 hypothetical protein [Roseicyclus sp. F158]